MSAVVIQSMRDAPLIKRERNAATVHLIERSTQSVIEVASGVVQKRTVSFRTCRHDRT